jgi:probable selenate reductase FAD-binding subunit
MLRELKDYYRPATIEQALTLLGEPYPVVPLAGGTELLGRRDTSTQAVVDLQDLGLDYITAQADGLHIGAMTRLQSLATGGAITAAMGEFIARAIRFSAAYTERCAATIGGAVAIAAPWNDLLPALLVVDAEVMLRAAGSPSRVALATLLGAREKYLPRGTLITEVLLPAQSRELRYAYRRVSRTPADRATLGVAVRAALEGSRAHVVRVALAGAAHHVFRLTVVESMLEGQDVSRPEVVASAERIAAGAVSPPSDHIASSAYRREMVGTLLRRTLADLSTLVEPEGEKLT